MWESDAEEEIPGTTFLPCLSLESGTDVPQPAWARQGTLNPAR